MEGNLNQLMNNSSNDAFDDNLRDQLGKMQMRKRLFLRENRQNKMKQLKELRQK